MKIITLLSQKGGSGKTTIALSLAVCADAKDKAAMVIDIDPQSSAASWAERREGLTPVVVAAQAHSLPALLDEARERGCELVLIDTAPHSETAAMKAVGASDLVLIPCRASVHDMDAIENSVTIAKLQKKQAYVLLNSVPHSAPKQIADVRAAIEGAYDVKVLPMVITQRSDFVHSATVGKAPGDFAPDGKAAAEIAALYGHVMNGEGLLSRLFSR